MLRTRIFLPAIAAIVATFLTDALANDHQFNESYSGITSVSKLVPSSVDQKTGGTPIRIAQSQIKNDKYPPAPKNSKVKRALRSSRCKGHVFEVNHYGKQGIELARENLNKYVADLKKKSPRKKIRVVEDAPRCYKFLDLILFDEWTCRIDTAICS